MIEPLEPLEVACDPTVLNVVLANLLGNAAKYTRDAKDRRIEVRARRDGGRVRVEVEDSGPGLPQGLERAVFEPYFRAPDVTEPGLGLGLATVHRFVTAHGGSVGVERGRIGTRFWFELPLAEAGA